jgi:hypothetical protein
VGCTDHRDIDVRATSYLFLRQNDLATSWVIGVRDGVIQDANCTDNLSNQTYLTF